MGLRFAILLVLTGILGCARSEESRQSSTSGDTTASEPAGPAEGTGEAIVHFTGFGPVGAGMTLAEAAQALGDSLPLLGPRMDPCYYVSNPSRPDVAFMVIEGRIARVDIRRESSVKTEKGARIGDSEERIRSLYPERLEVQPHKYVEGHYLIVRPAAPADTNYRIIFETDGKRVTSLRAGRMPEVRWVEGCS